jgi:hypothetical protein
MLTVIRTREHTHTHTYMASYRLLNVCVGKMAEVLYYKQEGRGFETDDVTDLFQYT